MLQWEYSSRVQLEPYVKYLNSSEDFGFVNYCAIYTWRKEKILDIEDILYASSIYISNVKHFR